MKQYLSWLLITIIFLSSYTLADTEIITLNNNTAQNVLPAVQNLLEPGGSVSAFQGKLIIKSSAQNIADIKNILASIDKPAKQLLISVRQDGIGSEANRSYGANGQIQVNPNVTITHNSDGTITQKTSSQTSVDIGSVNINSNNTRNNSTDNASQRISAMEGYPARISIGQQVPIVSTSKDRNGFNRSVEYQDVDQGFYVTAYLINDDQVQINVSTENDKLSAANRNTIDTQHASTTVSGNVGQWLSVGSIDQNSTQNENGILSQDDRFKQLNNSIYIKVDVVP